MLSLLDEHRWNVSNVAKALGISRNTLYRKMHRLHIRLSHDGPVVRRIRRRDDADAHARPPARRVQARRALRVVRDRLRPHARGVHRARAAAAGRRPVPVGGRARKCCRSTAGPSPKLREHFRVFRDNSASGVPVGMLYEGDYHTVVVAPATSNTVAKCALGISDTLPTNMFAQAGKLGMPGIVFACDTEPGVVTQSPHDWVDVRPRAIELDNVERLRASNTRRSSRSLDELEAALDQRLSTLGSHGTHRLPDRPARRDEPACGCSTGMAPAPFTWEVREIGLQVAGADDGRHDPPPRARLPLERDRIIVPGRCRGDLDALSRALRRAGRARPRGGEGPAAVLRPRGAAVRPVALRDARFSRRSSTRRGSTSTASSRARAPMRRMAPTSSTSAACRRRRFRISKTRCGG